MASIHKEIVIDASPTQVWDAVRDIGNIHKRLVPGFVTDTKLEEGARIVTFANGMVAREAIVDLDDKTRRLAWSATGGRLSHHNASMQLFDDDNGGTRAVWICDMLPNELAPAIAGMIQQGLDAMKKTLEQEVARS
jgi:carbon monoxide dehydrogenase subunit G